MDWSVIQLIQDGNSINQIVRITNLRKSTIYYHYRKIRGKKQKSIEFRFRNSNELGEFLGIFCGDGSFTKGKDWHYTIRIHLGYYEKEYAYSLAHQLAEWFQKKPHTYYTKYRNKNSGIILHYDSKKIYTLLQEHLEWIGKKTYTVKLRKLDLKNKRFNLGFLRGLIDTDGNYYAKKRRISFATTSINLANQAQMIIRFNAGLEPKFGITKKKDCSDLYTLSLHGKNTKKLITLIHPRNPNKIAPIV